jgi:hypothetical protein
MLHQADLAGSENTANHVCEQLVKGSNEDAACSALILFSLDLLTNLLRASLSLLEVGATGPSIAQCRPEQSDDQ